MLARESDLQPTGMHPLYRSIKLEFQGQPLQRFYNVCSFAVSNTMPASPGLLSGGILAEVMGLGKTLECLALIAATHEQNYTVAGSVFQNQHTKQWQPTRQHADDLQFSQPVANAKLETEDFGIRRSKRSKRAPGDSSKTQELLSVVGASLVLVPQMLVAQWKEEIARHTGGALRLIEYESKSRVTKEMLLGVDVVLCSMETCKRLQSKRNPREPESKPLLLQVHFRRVIVDEGHNLRNWTSPFSQFCADIHCSARWCVTGTPIPGRKLEDLYGLFKFLRHPIFEDHGVFCTAVVKPFATKELNALDTLRNTLSSICIRHTKADIQLPSKHINFHQIPMTNVESKRYLTALETASNRSQSSQLHYTLNQLRRVCAGESTREELAPASIPCSHCLNECQTAFATLTCDTGHEIILCADCRTLQLLVTEDVEDTVSPVCCSQCDQEIPKEQLKSSQLQPDSTPQCCIRESSKSRAAAALIASAVHGEHGPPAKVLVFSSFTPALQAVKQEMEVLGIRTVEFHGQVAPEVRAQNVIQFQNDPSVPVFLMSSRMASCGLTLTTASIVVLLEPQLLAGMEQQAMDRAHRIGQTRDVIVHRLVSVLPTGEHTVENRMIEQQNGVSTIGRTLRSADKAALRLFELQKIVLGDQTEAMACGL
eukprot:TRINITY_DN11970_c0_g1_i2.p2 TRINITY_DN11970_c0_g1~~TRINITY_DN11970_c0_g1_i2.p2  ORF type:complete len:654 (+),score=111.41 TRINITY_DN11970_c0_g1_i2:1784-3745(+)